MDDGSAFGKLAGLKLGLGRSLGGTLSPRSYMPLVAEHHGWNFEGLTVDDPGSVARIRSTSPVERMTPPLLGCFPQPLSRSALCLRTDFKACQEAAHFPSQKRP